MVLELHHRTRRCSLPSGDVRRDGIYSAYCRSPVLLDMEFLPSQLQAFSYVDARMDDLDRFVQIPSDRPEPETD